ncbi:MAG TPA: hypothetical protein VLE53_16625 [Gemmatimonadaceae bacterium]|nr:hypothetical protein [Gemmatimonadaceae bacterium]
MQRHLVRILLVGTAAAAVAACDTPSSPTLVTAAATPLISGAPALAQGVVASAAGSAHYFSGGELRTMGFSAVAMEDGTASGEYQINIHAIDRYLHVTVTCMVVRNDTAWVAGIIDRTNHPAIVPGTVSYFWTVDNGEQSGVPDEMSTARINDAAGQDQVFCGLTPDEQFSGLPGNVLVHGNVQVRGG